MDSKSHPDKYPSGEAVVMFYQASTFSKSYKLWRTEQLKNHRFITEKTIGSGVNAVTILTVIPK